MPDNKRSTRSWFKGLYWLFALSLCACTVGPDYRGPPSTATPRWTELAKVPKQGESPSLPVAEIAVPVRWWTLLRDPLLDSLVTRAIGANLDLRQAEVRVREARAQRGVVASEWLPSINASSSYSRARISQNSAVGLLAGALNGGSTGALTSTKRMTLLGTDINLFQAGFDALWELDLFGGVRRQVEAAKAEIGAAEEDSRGVEVSLVAEVARNYLELRQYQRRLAIARDTLRSEEESLAIAKARYREGVSSELDAARAEAQVDNTRAQLPKLTTQTLQAQHRLEVLLAKQPGSLQKELDVAQQTAFVPPQVPIGLPSELLRRRPDIRHAERQVADTTARIGAATADLFPKVSLTGMFGLESISLSNFGSLASRFYSLGPQIRWPIFEGGRLLANIRVQEARQEESLIAYDKAVLTAFEEVANALTAYNNEQARRKEIAKAVTANLRALEIAQAQYRVGASEYLEVLDAQRTLYADQDGLAQTEASVSENLVALYKALGGGWEQTETGEATQSGDER